MLYQSVNGASWRKSTIKKLISFSEKCPILISIVTDTMDGVKIIHENSGKEYKFNYDYTTDPKNFIHKIKEQLYPHYPILLEPIEEEHTLTPDELAYRLERGQPYIEKENVLKGHRVWRIDKVISWKDTLILNVEKVLMYDDDGNEVEVSDDTVGKSYRYRLDKSSALFLRKYRQGGYNDLEEASRDFFDNAVLIDTLTKKQQERE